MTNIIRTVAFTLALLITLGSVTSFAQYGGTYGGGGGTTYRRPPAATASLILRRSIQRAQMRRRRARAATSRQRPGKARSGSRK
jgi:hypothetical protein